MNQPWLEKEEEYFEKAWLSGAYDKEDLESMFQRSWMALTKKAGRMKLPTWETMAAMVRLEAIEKMLSGDKII